MHPSASSSTRPPAGRPARSPAAFVTALLAASASCAEPVPATPDLWRAVRELEPRGVRTLLVSYTDDTRAEVAAVADGLDLDALAFADVGPAGGLVLDRSVDYVRCDEGDCEVLATFEAGTEIRGMLASPRGSHELIVHGSDEETVLDVFDLTQGRQTSRIPADGWQYRWHNQPLSWVGEDRVIAVWGAGTNVGSALLYDVDGTLLLAVGGDAVSLSPDGGFLAYWHGPRADGDTVELFDLALEPDDLAMVLPPELRGPVEIDDVLWGSAWATVLLATDEPDRVRPVLVSLGP